MAYRSRRASGPYDNPDMSLITELPLFGSFRVEPLPHRSRDLLLYLLQSRIQKHASNDRYANDIPDAIG